MGNSDITTWPPVAIAGLAVLAVIQVSLMVWALVDLLRRERVVGGRKWVWLVVILFVNTIGSIVYLAVGRNVPPQAADPLAQPSAEDGDRVERAADTLYGQR